MKTKLFISAALFAGVLTACNGNSKSNDTGTTDSSAADSTEILMADSIARTDSIAREDSIARADSAAKAEAVAKAEAAAKADPKIDKELKTYAQYVDDLSPASIATAGAGSWIAHESQAASEVEASLQSKVSRMTPEQKKRFDSLKATMKSYN